MTDQLLIIFAKNPVLGKVKTRLASTVGKDRALQIYLKLLDYTRSITTDLPLDKVVFYSDFIDEGDQWDNSVYHKQQQPAGDLGDRMKYAFNWGFSSGYSDICIIGSDCYELTPETIMSGFEALKTADTVLGPSRDGGYYLLGLKKVYNKLFNCKDWGTKTVAAATLNDIQSLQLSNVMLESLSDIDVEADLGNHEL